MADTLYKGIRETAEIIGVEQHTLRFWEEKFPYLNPKKNTRSVRCYDADDIAYLQQIYHYLKNEGYTIQGVLKLIKKHGISDFRKGVSHPPKTSTSTTAAEHSLFGEISQPQNANITQDLQNILERLQKLRIMVSK